MASSTMVSPESPPQFLLHGSDLQPFIPLLLESNYIVSLVIFIHKFIQTPIIHKHFKKRILDSLSFHYPNSFSLKLARLLSLNPPFHIRNEAVSLLQQTLTVTPTNHYHRIRCDIFVELKSLILEQFKAEIHEKLLPLLSTTIADLAHRIYAFPCGGWLELLEYIVSCVRLNSNDDHDHDSVLKQRKGLMLLADLPGNVAEHCEFWKNNYTYLCQNLVVRIVDENARGDLKALVFFSLSTMLEIAQPLGEYKIGRLILSILLEKIDRHSDEEIVVTRFHFLRNFVSLDVDLVLSGKEGNVFYAMLRVADKNGASKELRCAAVEVIKGLGESRLSIMDKLMKKLSEVDAQRVIKVSMDMMFESDTQCFELGKSLLNWLSYRGEGSFVFPMLMDFLKTTYAASKDLKRRHTVMIVIARFAVENISDLSVFATEIIKMISDEINHIISIIVESGQAEEAGISEGGSEYLSDEEIIQSSNLLLSITTKALKGRLSPFVGELFSTIAQLLGNDSPDRVKAIAFSFLNIIGPHFPDQLQRYHDRYTCELLKAREGSLHAEVETARGIGICAMYGGEKFKTIVNEAISKLYSLIEHGHSIKGEDSSYGANKYDMAVTALAMICEFHPENIDERSEVIRNWLSFLPLTDNLNLAKNVHGHLSKMLNREDADVLGPNNENLPEIVSILRTILLGRDELATEETSSEIIGFLDKHGDGMW